MKKSSNMIIIGSAVLSFLLAYELIKNIITDLQLHKHITDYESIIVYGGPLLFFIVVIIVIKMGIKKAHNINLDETDFEENKDYYRDIINEYSISTLNYIDKFKLEKKQSYTAKLLDLQNKGIIKVENDNIIVINNPTEMIDIYFINSINNNKITLSLSDYENLTIEEAIKKDLIIKNDDNKIMKYRNIVIVLFIVTIIACGILSLTIVNKMLSNITSDIAIYIVLEAVCMLIFVFCFFFFLSYHEKISEKRLYKRTEKGKYINKQLDGLKAFMEEFSNIDSKESKYLALWEDYLIYSVMFNINKKIQEDYSKYFD